MTWRGELFSSLASPGHLETEAVKASNPGVRVAGGPRPGRGAWLRHSRKFVGEKGD